MKRTLLMMTVLASAAAVLHASAAYAQPADQRTFLTFSAPVELPGRVLPAGRYEFRLADDGETLDVVQVLKGNDVVGTYLTIPTDSLKFPDKPYVTFEQSGNGAAPAIRAWFYPGDSVGREFVYPRQRAVAIARAAQQPVKTTTDDMAAQMNAEEPAAQRQAVAALKDAPVQVATPNGEDVEVVDFELIQMPKTASTLPAALVSGLALILLGVAVGRVGRVALAS
jgi:hypothetical protein